MYRELKNTVRAFGKYGLRGFSYVYWRYIMAPRIMYRRTPIHSPTARSDLEIHMLFGERDFLMALWSLASFYCVMPEVGVLVVHSDGTLTDTHKGILKKLFPTCVIEDAAHFLHLHEQELLQFPDLITFRREFKGFQAKKLIDQYVVAKKPLRLLLDSDMVWFKEPTEIVESIRQGVPRPLMMTNADARVHVLFKDGSTTSDRVAQANSGIVLYRVDQFSLSAVDRYVALTDYRNKKFTDQACFASVLEPDFLPDERYLIKGTLTKDVVMRHYTSPQRLKFYFYGINRVYRDIL